MTTFSTITALVQTTTTPAWIIATASLQVYIFNSSLKDACKHKSDVIPLLKILPEMGHFSHSKSQNP